MISPPDLKNILVLNPNPPNCDMLKSLDQFYLLSCNLQPSAENNSSEVIVGLKLKRIFSYHLTNTYMPTITLLIIAEITLHFDDTKTELAIGLSLTIMLVMYTMYQSISGSLIKTAYLKMIDYWLLFCLLMPFVIFIIEIYWLLQKNKKLNATLKGWVQEENKINNHRKLIQYLAHGISGTFVTCYFLIAILMYNRII
jgi:hypothetical protein